MISVEVTVKVPIEKAWDFWITPKHIQNWNAAFDNWYTAYADNDLKVEGKFKYEMTSRDNTGSFDFEGIYTKIEKFRLIEYQLSDDRIGSIYFEDFGDKVKITEKFEPNKTDPESMQENWCQDVLNNFKKYTENS
ncbi:SRPBCC domain-containing protein [Flavobacterium sp. P21]|uniref:SRPBCC domain-containing protein n=1 Tax=Flavobacterium sp. P21 TaxID=3423948 RepID=UPI003D66E03E